MIRLILFSDKEVNCLCPPQCEPGPYAQETLDWQSTARRSYPLCHYVNRCVYFPSVHINLWLRRYFYYSQHGFVIVMLEQKKACIVHPQTRHGNYATMCVLVRPWYESHHEQTMTLMAAVFIRFHMK